MASHPSLFDYFSLWALKAAKLRNKAASADLYENFFEDYHFEQYQKDIRSILKHNEIRRVISELTSLNACLDLGCGVGHILRLFPSGSRKIAIDVSQKTLAIAKRYLGDDATFLQSSATEIPLPDANIDLITCFEVLEHLADDKAALKEIARIVRPGGYFLLSVPNQYYFSDYEPLMGHLRHYSQSELVQLLKEHGFTFVKSLQMYPATNRIYFFVYVFMEAINFLMNKIFSTTKTIYQRRIPFTSKLFYDTCIRPLFLWIGSKEAQKKNISSSTFLLMQRTTNN